MANFEIKLSDESYILLKGFLTMDPNNRITTTRALADQYFKNDPTPVRDAFACYKKIPFPLRPYLPKKITTTEAIAESSGTRTVNTATVASTSTARFQNVPRPNPRFAKQSEVSLSKI